MLIDWFTVGAQIVNFLILVFLLKRFLYAPILRAMDQRESRIADRTRDAESKRVQAEEEAREYRRKNRELDDERTHRIEEAEKDARERRRELLARARAEADETREAWRLAVEREQEAFLRQLRVRVGSQVARICRKALADLAGEELGASLVRVFLRRLEGLSEPEREQCVRAARGRSAIVRTPVALDPRDKGRITKALHEVCSAGTEVEYRADPDLALGIEMTLGDLRFAWDVQTYLDQLEKEIEEALEETGPQNGEAPVRTGKADPETERG